MTYFPLSPDLDCYSLSPSLNASFLFGSSEIWCFGILVRSVLSLANSSPIGRIVFVDALDVPESLRYKDSSKYLLHHHVPRNKICAVLASSSPTGKPTFVDALDLPESLRYNIPSKHPLYYYVLRNTTNAFLASSSPVGRTATRIGMGVNSNHLEWHGNRSCLERRKTASNPLGCDDRHVAHRQREYYECNLRDHPCVHFDAREGLLL